MHDESFIQAIVDAPDDDAPRLIYADWLDERGDAKRAELIRVQCRLERTTVADPEHDDLLDAERELLAEHGEEWAARLLDAARESGVRGSLRYRFRRGLLEHVELRCDAAPGSVPRIFDAAPALLSLSARAPTVSEIAADAGLEASDPRYSFVTSTSVAEGPRSFVARLIAEPRATRLVALKIGGLNAAGLSELLDSPVVRRLRSLDLSHGDFGGVGVAAIARAENLRGLERLALRDVARNSPLLRSSVAALVDERSLPQLSSLDLAQNFVSDSTAVLLLQGALVKRLAELNVDANEISDDVWRQAAERATAPKLRSLHANARFDGGLRTAEQLSAEGLRRLLRWAPGLTKLDVSGHAFGDDGAEAIVEHAASDLRELIAGGCEIDERGIAALGSAARLSRLERLELPAAPRFRAALRPGRAIALAEGESFRALRVLNLQGHPLGDDGVAALAASESLSGLRELNLSQTQLGSRGLVALAESESLRALRRLWLYANGPFDNRSIDALRTSRGLSGLRTLGVGANNFSSRGYGLAALRGSFGERVHFL